LEIFERRLERFKTVISNRQDNLIIILENIWDPHNIGAIFRSCDSVGVHRIFIINSDPKLQTENKYQRLSSASGASKWLELSFFNEVKPAIEQLKSLNFKILSTHLSADSSSMYEVDFNKPIALAFGNEHAGISDELLSLSDGNVLIPQYGMTQSLNISVACAVCLFEISRQRKIAGSYDIEFDGLNPRHAELFEKYKSIHIDKKLKGRELPK